MRCSELRRVRERDFADSFEAGSSRWNKTSENLIVRNLILNHSQIIRKSEIFHVLFQSLMPYLAALGPFSNLPAEAMRVILNLVLASMVECIALFCGTFLHLKWTSAPARPLSRTPKARPSRPQARPQSRPRVEEPSEERPEPSQTLHRQEGRGVDKTKGAKGSSEREDFERATLALKEGKLKPSIRSMTKHFQRGTDTVAAWFRRWEKAGLVTRTETGRFKVAARA